MEWYGETGETGSRGVAGAGERRGGGRGRGEQRMLPWRTRGTPCGSIPQVFYSSNSDPPIPSRLSAPCSLLFPLSLSLRLSLHFSGPPRLRSLRLFSLPPSHPPPPTLLPPPPVPPPCLDPPGTPAWPPSPTRPPQTRPRRPSPCCTTRP
jgi:hypothetical protein